MIWVFSEIWMINSQFHSEKIKILSYYLNESILRFFAQSAVQDQFNYSGGDSMSRDKLGLFAFGLVLLGFAVFVKTGSFLLFSLGILSVAFLIFSKNKFIK
jgi:hypothetical protein